LSQREWHLGEVGRRGTLASSDRWLTPWCGTGSGPPALTTGQAEPGLASPSPGDSAATAVHQEIRLNLTAARSCGQHRSHARRHHIPNLLRERLEILRSRQRARLLQARPWPRRWCQPRIRARPKSQAPLPFAPVARQLGHHFPSLEEMAGRGLPADMPSRPLEESRRSDNRWPPAGPCQRDQRRGHRPRSLRQATHSSGVKDQ
jgi:hypothetical protein